MSKNLECNKCDNKSEVIRKFLDDYYDFNELHHHKIVLFSIICNAYQKLSWKSLRNYDGTMNDDFFIAGINTEEGQFAYRCYKDYWRMFQINVLDYAPECDENSSNDINRLLSLRLK